MGERDVSMKPKKNATMIFCDLHKQYKAYQREIDAAIQQVIDAASFINGKEITLLEEELSAYTGVRNAICCCSGTDALLLPMMAWGIGPGDEVICPAYSYIATASMVSLLKARPVFVDVLPGDFNIDVSRVEEKITPRTRGIIAVSLFGRCAAYDALNALAAKYGLWVIEDGAQSFGATFFGKPSCSLTTVGTTSFFPAKPLGCYGDGGAVFTSDDALAAKIRMIRAHGQEKRYYHKVIGINGRIDTLQAAILRVKLNYFDRELAVRRQAAALYTELLGDVVRTPVGGDGKTSTWAQYTILTPHRDRLRAELQARGIPTAIHYPLPLPEQEAFAGDVVPGEMFPVARELSRTVLSLPIHGFITGEEVRHVAGAVADIVSQIPN
jgi:UDP-2-acetamido-2-deoxy-ribo-hexuluronate aminotransferase